MAAPHCSVTREKPNPMVVWISRLKRNIDVKSLMFSMQGTLPLLMPSPSTPKKSCLLLFFPNILKAIQRTLHFEISMWIANQPEQNSKKCPCYVEASEKNQARPPPLGIDEPSENAHKSSSSRSGNSTVADVRFPRFGNQSPKVFTFSKQQDVTRTMTEPCLESLAMLI